MGKLSIGISPKVKTKTQEKKAILKSPATIESGKKKKSIESTTVKPEHIMQEKDGVTISTMQMETKVQVSGNKRRKSAVHIDTPRPPKSHSLFNSSPDFIKLDLLDKEQNISEEETKNIQKGKKRPILDEKDNTPSVNKKLKGDFVPSEKTQQSNPKKGKKKNVGNVEKTLSLFIGRLPFDITQEELEEHFRKSVDFLKLRMPIFENSQKPRGFAFIDVASEKDYQAVLALNKSVLKGKQISVEYTCAGSKNSKKRSARIKAKTLKFKSLQDKGIMPKGVKKAKSSKQD